MPKPVVIGGGMVDLVVIRFANTQPPGRFKKSHAAGGSERVPMRQKPTILAGKSENVTRAQARKAAVAARGRKSAKKFGKRGTKPGSVSSAFYERYLGHFGEAELEGGSSGKKFSSKKKGLRKAS
jgi:hypothetical protein